MKVIINADGAARGNPGPAAIGATLKDRSGKLLASVSKRIGRTTNNQAEYRAVIAAFEEALKLGAAELEVYLDSELVVHQLNGRYRVKHAALKPLHQRAKELQSRFRSSVVHHIPRRKNVEADNLANAAFG